MVAKTVLKKMTHWKSLALAAALVGLMTIPATAQNQGGQQYRQQQQQQQQYQQQQQQQPPPADFSDQDLEKFVEVQSKVDDIRSEYSEALSDVEDNAEAQALQETYSHRMVQVIEDKGLSVEDYNNIIMAMQGNTELREKVNDMMN